MVYSIYTVLLRLWASINIVIIRMHIKYIRRRCLVLETFICYKKNYYDFKDSACNITLIKSFSEEDRYSQTILVQDHNTKSSQNGT